MLVNEVQFGLLFIFRVEPDDFQFILAFSSEKWTRRRPLLLLAATTEKLRLDSAQHLSLRDNENI